MEEGGWSAQIEIGVTWYTKFFERGYVEVSGNVKFSTQAIIGTRPAVPYSTAAMRQHLHKAACLLRKRMFVVAARAVEPPHLAWRACRRQCVKHGEDRRRSNACAQQNNGPLTGLKSETAPRRAHVQDIADPHVGVHVRAAEAVRFLLDTDAIMICARRVRKGVAA